MTKNFISYTLMFVFLVAAQAVIFNRIWLFHTAMPIVFIYFFVSLPVDLNAKWVLTLSFLLGFCIDMFSDTPGLNAMCSTITGGLRTPILKLYASREDEITNPIPSPRSMGWITYMKYLITITTIYSLLFFMILSFEFFEPGRLILRIIGTSLLSFIIMLAFSNFIIPSTGKRK